MAGINKRKLRRTAIALSLAWAAFCGWRFFEADGRAAFAILDEVNATTKAQQSVVPELQAEYREQRAEAEVRWEEAKRDSKKQKGYLLAGILAIWFAYFSLGWIARG